MEIRRTARLLIACSVLATVLGASEAGAAETVATQQEKDIATLRSLIIESGDAFNDKDPDRIMALYASDVVLSYPGIPDMGYADFAKAYSELRNSTPGVTVKTSPNIEEILVSGDLGVIRITWNTTTTETNPPKESTRQMKDLQIWRRQADGTWKLSRGMHYRMPPAQEAPKPAAPTP
ncbi:MAG TPA: nuclear transport factor 2 family protein [Thermoanaerobaculia bacterium]|nr:nuclear transport factor 2 family protein [Thermoanaerobaculia bacterium]